MARLDDIQALTIKDISDALQVSPRTVRRWIDEEGLPAFKVEDARQAAVRVRKSELLRWMRERETKSAAERDEDVRLLARAAVPFGSKIRVLRDTPTSRRYREAGGRAVR